MAHNGDPDDGYSFQFSIESEYSPTMDIVEAVAWVKDVKLTDLEPLAEYVDADALNNLYGDASGDDDFVRESGDTAGNGIRVEFLYEDVVVTVQGLDQFKVEFEE